MTLALLLLLSPMALADPESGEQVNPFLEPDESELFRLDEQLVTVASRYQQTLRKAPSIVTLVTADEIRRRGHRNLSDVLRQIPGIYVWKTPEGRDLVSFRGVVSADNNKTLLLVDGVPWYDGVYTHASIDDYLPISHVKQIEVIKGPGSAIYGTNAFAGVINVVTWSPADIDGFRARAVVGGVGRTDITAMVGGRDTVGGLAVEASAYARVLDNYGDGPDLSPRERPNILGNDPANGIAVGGRINVANLSLQIHHVDHRRTYLQNEADDPISIAQKDVDQYNVGFDNTFFEARYRWSTPWRVDVVPYINSQRHNNPGNYFFSLGHSSEAELPFPIRGEPLEIETYEQVITVETEKDTRRQAMGIDLEARPGMNHVVVGGVGAESVRVLRIFDQQYQFDPDVPGGEHIPERTGFEAPAGASLWNGFAYGQWTWTALPEFELTAGGRIDYRFAPFGDVPDDPRAQQAFLPVISPRIGLLWVPSEAVTGKLLYGRAFRAPNVRELLVAAPFDEESGSYDFSHGNLGVRPETIQTIEGQLALAPSEALNLNVSGNYSQHRGEIDKAQPLNEYVNFPTPLHIVGAEASAQVKYDVVTFTAQYALTLARYGAPVGDDIPAGTAVYEGRQQYEFPPHMVKGGVDLALTEHLGGWFGGDWYSARPRNDWSPTVNQPDGRSFGLLNIGVQAKKLGKADKVEMNVAVRNVLNSEWETGVYRDDLDRESGGGARFPRGFEGEGRSVHVALEVGL